MRVPAPNDFPDPRHAGPLFLAVALTSSQGDAWRVTGVREGAVLWDAWMTPGTPVDVQTRQAQGPALTRLKTVGRAVQLVAPALNAALLSSVATVWSACEERALRRTLDNAGAVHPFGRLRHLSEVCSAAGLPAGSLREVCAAVHLPLPGEDAAEQALALAAVAQRLKRTLSLDSKAW